MKISLSRTVATLAASLMLAPLALAGDAAAFLGAWKAVASTPNGDMGAVITIEEAGDELSAEMVLEGTERRVTNESLEGDVFKMTVFYEGVAYDVELTVDGDEMKGLWSGTDASGTLKATREP